MHDVHLNVEDQNPMNLLASSFRVKYPSLHIFPSYSYGSKTA